MNDVFSEIKQDCKYIRYYDGDTVGHCFGQKNAPQCDFELCADRKCGFKCSGNYVIEKSNANQEIIDNKEFMNQVNINILKPKFGEWISVEDRLPEIETENIRKRNRCYSESIRVLCVCKQKSGKVMVKEGYCRIYDDDHISWKIPGSIDSVTHWMPLPQPPKGE